MFMSNMGRRLRLALSISLLFCCAAASPLRGEEKTTKLSDAEKLEIINRGQDDFSRGQRIRDFAKEGAIDAVGRFVAIDKKIYFKTADQSYIPAEERFPYPELFLECHVSETHAYQPLFEQSILQNRKVLYDGPVRIQGNWAYEGAFHIFGLVWVDEATKVATAPEVDWGPWLKTRQQKGKSSAAAKE